MKNKTSARATTATATTTRCQTEKETERCTSCNYWVKPSEIVWREGEYALCSGCNSSPGTLTSLFSTIMKEIGPSAFSNDIYTCKKCGHRYTGYRLCPKCGA